MIDLTNQYELRIKVNGKRQVKEYPHTDGFTYIEGRKGSEYIIEIENKSFERVMAVISVDGLSVLNGTTNWDDGYIVDPKSTIQIPGWTIDKTKIAKFEFEDPYKSYTNKVGNGSSNIGVIGVMIFREKMHHINAVFGKTRSIVPNLPEQYPFDKWTHIDPLKPWFGTVSSSASSSQNSAELSLGTGWGDETNFNITEVKFERRDSKNPDATLAVYYDSAKGLEKRGIVLDFSKYNPNPFPGLETSIGCKRPR